MHANYASNNRKRDDVKPSFGNFQRTLNYFLELEIVRCGNISTMFRIQMFENVKHRSTFVSAT